MNKFLKMLAIAFCAIALVVCSVAATVAYLAMKTAPVNNTFTAGNINITLTPGVAIDGKTIVPGAVFEVNPKVTVKANSVDCWLFVKIDETKIDETTGFKNYLPYEIADGWSVVTGAPGVYSRKVTSNDYDLEDDVEFDIIKGNSITANAAATKADYDKVSDSLTLDFTAYAVQSTGFASAASAWVEAKKLDTAGN